MNGLLGEVDTGTFLQRHWQRRPLLVRGAFSDLASSFDENDLAGLACEDYAESRLVRGSFPQNDWTLEHGPFSEEFFSTLPECGWTLLVQDVEKHYPPLQSLMERFDFLPSWRLDDLMISYAVEGGSVGPHVDQYDVFLVQASGSKRWQIATSFSKEHVPGCPLDVLQEFNPEQEWVLEAGDMLYLPPNVAHHGVALEPGMTWSVGLRAPSAADLMSAFAEQLAASADGGPRYTDPPLDRQLRSGEVDRASVRQAAGLLSSSLSDEHAFAAFFVSFMSRYRLAQEPANPEPPVGWEDIEQRLSSGASLARNPWTRLAWLESGTGAVLFAAGCEVHCSVDLATALCRSAEPRFDTAGLSRPDSDAICKLVNAGHLVWIAAEGED